MAIRTSFLFMVIAIAATAIAAGFIIMNYPVAASDATMQEIGFTPKELVMKVGVNGSTAGEILPIAVTQEISLNKSADHIRLFELYPDWNTTDTRVYNSTIIDSAGKAAIRPNEQVFHEAALGTLPVECGNGDHRIARYTPAFIVPIADNLTGNLFVKYSFAGLESLDGGETYELKFASAYKTTIVLPDNVKVLRDNSAECKSQSEEFSKNEGYASIFVYDIVFKLNPKAVHNETSGSEEIRGPPESGSTIIR